MKNLSKALASLMITLFLCTGCTGTASASLFGSSSSEEEILAEKQEKLSKDVNLLSKEIINVKEDVSKQIKVVKDDVSKQLVDVKGDFSKDIEKVKKDVSDKYNTVDTKLSQSKSEIKKLQKSIKDLESNLDKQRKQQSAFENKTDEQFKRISSKTEKFDKDISVVKDKGNKTKEDIQHRTLIGCLLVAFVLLIIFILSLLGSKKLSHNRNELGQLVKKNDEINLQIISKMSGEADGLNSLISSVLDSRKEDNDQSEKNVNHDLIKALADRIMFMQVTLSRMDNSVRGYRQMSKSINQMKDNLLANGYELVDMLGTRYNEGMKVIANFVEDESLEKGEQIITGVIKPQLNYKGEMIQAAQITVSQNI